MIKKNPKFFLVLIVIAAFFLRFYKLAEYPVHLGHDEVTQLYDAISIARTGRDIYGNYLPFIFQSVNDYKPPFYTYMTVVSYLIFGWKEITIRVPGAIFGTLMIPAVYFFVNRLMKKKEVALIAAGLTAIAPFELFYSRKSFENQAGIVLILLGFGLLLGYIDNRKKLKQAYCGMFVLSLAIYTYFSHAVLIPILVVAFLLIYRKKIGKEIRKPIILALLVAAPLYFLIYSNSDARNRSQAVFITQDPRLAEKLERTESQAVKLVILGTYSAARYLNHLNPSYLFWEGLNMTEGKRDVGPLFAVSLPFFIAGIYFLVRQKENRQERFFLLSWILIGLIPSGVTFEDFSPHRSVMVLSMLNVVSAFGIYWFYQKYKPFALVILLILFGLNFAFFVKRYTLNFPIERSEKIHYPYREVARYAWENYDKYDQIVFDPKFGEFAPWIGTGAHYYLAFYGNYPPEKMQREFRTGDLSKRETKFDKFSIRAVQWIEDKDLKDTLIIASPWSLPIDISEQANVLKIFYFKTTAPAFYAIEL